MTTKTLLSLAMVGLFAATAKVEAYEVVATNAWFTASLPESATPGASWTKSEGCVIVVNDAVTFDTTMNAPLYWSETAKTADGYCVKSRVKVVLNATAPSECPTAISESVVKGSLIPTAVAFADPSQTSSWYGLTGDSAWTQLSGCAPLEGNMYDLMIEFKTNATHNCVRYSAKLSSESSYTVLGAGWYERSSKGSGQYNPTKFGFSGSGELAALSADTVSYFEITAAAEKLVEAGIIADAGQPVTEAVLNETGANGLPKWQSLVLGLKANVATSKPYTAPVQTSSNTLGFTIGNVDTSKYGETGATVTFDVVECNSDGTGETTIAEETAKNVAAGSTAEVAAPGSVKYYKIKIKITK